MLFRSPHPRPPTLVPAAFGEFVGCWQDTQLAPTKEDVECMEALCAACAHFSERDQVRDPLMDLPVALHQWEDWLISWLGCHHLVCFILTAAVD